MSGERPVITSRGDILPSVWHGVVLRQYWTNGANSGHLRKPHEVPDSDSIVLKIFNISLFCLSIPPFVQGE